MLASTSAQAAGIDLIAVGQVNSSGADKAIQTSAPLENRVPGNLLGGLGSGLAYAGCRTFLALPDRGPNAVTYNAAISNTTSYINRFQTLRMQLVPAATGAALPFRLNILVERTTLLWSPTPLAYGSGKGLDVGPGAPKLNRSGRNYFTGRSDNFAVGKPSSDPANARLDTESIRVSPDGTRVYIGDEYGPSINAFDRATGRRLAHYALPSALAVAHPSANTKREISGNGAGRYANHGMEGLAITPDGKVLFGVMQGPLLQDGGKKGSTTRIVRVDLTSGVVTQFAYPLQDIGRHGKHKFTTVSEALAINGHTLLVLERGGKGLGDDSKAKVKRIWRVELDHATPLGSAQGEASLAKLSVTKTLFLDVVDQLARHGIEPGAIPAKLEGLAFGPDVTVQGHREHTLFLTSDNDFLAQVQQGSEKVANPNRFYVFGVIPSALPGYVPEPHAGDCARASPSSTPLGAGIAIDTAGNAPK